MKSAARILLALLPFAAGAAAAQDTAPGNETFYGRSQVTAVDLVVDVRDPSGRVPADLSPADFEVLEDGVAVPVVGVELQLGGSARGGAAAGGDAAPAAPAEGVRATEWTWHTVIYVDQVLSGSGSIRRALQALAGEAGRLVELGTVELVAANPRPEVLLPPTRSARLVEQRLLEAARQLSGRDAIRQVRRQYQQLLITTSALNGRHVNFGIHGAPARDLSRADTSRDSLRQERILLENQQDRMLAWGASHLATGPRALILVNDGYDLDPRDYYLQGIQPDSRLHTTLGGALQEDVTGQRLLDVAKTLASSGWVSLNVALAIDSTSGSFAADVDGKGRVAMMLSERGRDANTPGDLPAKLVYRPLEPLNALAEKTGGEVVTGRGGISDALVRLGERVRLTYQVERLPDGRVHDVRVRARRPGLTVKAPEFSGSPAPEAASSARARRLLESSAERGDMPLIAAVAPAADGDGEPSSGQGAGGRSTVQARIDLTALGVPAGAPPTSLRVTLAVSFADGARGEREPFVRHEVVPGQDLGGLDYWTYTLPVTLPPEAERISVVIEDLASGSWGGAVAAKVARLPPELSRPLGAHELARDERGELPEGVYDLAPDLLPDKKAIVLLRPEGSVLTGRVAFDTLVTRPDVARVELRLDGERVETVGRPPFEARIDLGGTPRPRTVEAIAYDAGGDELGRDSLVVNEGAGSFRVRLIEPRETDAVGPVDVEAEVNLRSDDRLARVEIAWNDELVATLYEPPFRQRIHVPADAPVGYVAVTAHLVDGSSAEDVVFLNGTGGDERVEVQLVELPAVVVDPSGRLVRGLGEADFRVSEEARPQPIAAVHDAADLPLSLGLLLDSSASMADVMQRTQIAAIDFLYTTLGENDRAFLVDFDSTPRLVQPLTSDMAAIAGRVMKTRADGYTALCDALVFSLVEMQQVRGRRALVVLSDGVGREERVGFATCLRLVRRVGVPVYLVVLDRDARSARQGEKVEQIAAAAGGRVFFVSDLDALGGVYRTIGEELRSQYLVTYYPEPRADAGSDFRRVSVEVMQPGLAARTVAGYYP
jgi:Ca-activated chloride channel homolog